MSGPRHSVPGGHIVALAAIAASLVTGCEDRNRGIPPDEAGLYFPSGIALDPRVPNHIRARWLFALNGNSDLVYNSGSIVPIDLKKFFDAWMVDADACFEGDVAGCKAGSGIVPGGVGPKIGDVGAEPTEAMPCRRNAYKPQVIECEDTFLIEEPAAVHVGNFGRALTGWTREVVGDEPATEGTLFAAVRGDPSVTHVTVSGDPDRIPKLTCVSPADPTLYDPRRCTESYKLTYLRNDYDSSRLATEPSNILATPGSPYVLVSHATAPAITLIDMDGQYTQDRDDKGNPKQINGVLAPVEKDAVPAIVQMRSLFELAGQANGGWGLALRPCRPGAAPALTIGKDADGEPVDCARPMIYAGFRTALYVNRTVISETDPLTETVDLEWARAALDGVEAKIVEVDEKLMNPGSQAAELEQQRAMLVRQRRFYNDLLSKEGAQPFDQRCLLASEIRGEELSDDLVDRPRTKGAFLCDARLYGAGLFRAAAFDIGSTGSSLGDIAFSRDGQRLFVVQTNPGGLAFVDTSIDSDGQPRDQSAGLIELCAQPTGMQVFYDGEYEYAAVTCYKPQEVFIVDLGGVRVVANIAVGTGPHPMAVDPARDLMYIANTLDKTISVVDLSPRRPTRFVEIARIGRQVPYNR